jgi:DNA-binding XRE family transcriptional regulator
VHFSTLAKLERGAHNPSIDTTIALARWLGWSAEQVIEAARTPATPPTSEAS